MKCESLRFIRHHMPTAWGGAILIMERRGKAFVRIYWFADDKGTVCIDWLSVDAEIRKRGVGTALLEACEAEGRSLGATTACLWVRKETWMHEWYKRLGYKDLRDNEAEENAIWMDKRL